MKKLILICLTLTFGLSSQGCKKTLESIVDCAGESALVGIHATADATDPKLFNVSVTYSGSNKVSSVEWQFGDGSTATTTTLATIHTYAAAGSYELKANVKIDHSGGSCSTEPKRTVTVN